MLAICDHNHCLQTSTEAECHYDLVGLPGVGNFRSTLLDADNAVHLIEAWVVADTIIEWHLILQNHT